MIAGLSARYETLRFLAYLVVGVGVAVILALVWPLLHGGPFRHSVEAGFYFVGALAFFFAAAGGSPSRRDASSAGWMDRWASAGTFAVDRDNQPARTLRPVVVLGAIGVIMIALGWAIS